MLPRSLKLNLVYWNKRFYKERRFVLSTIFKLNYMSVISIKNIKNEDCACPKLGETATKINPCIHDDTKYVKD